MIPIALAGIALLSGSQGQEPGFRLLRRSTSAESTFADAKLLDRAAGFLLQGPTGRTALYRDATGRDARRSQAARLVMLGSGDARFLPVILGALREEPSPNASISNKAIDLYPRASWPILRDLARDGVPGAIRATANYAEKGEPELRDLAHYRSAKVRAEAIRWVADPATIQAAVDDPAEAVQRNAVERLIGISQVIIEPFFTHPRASVRAAFAEFYPAWTQKDFPRWVRLAQDPSPRVRRWAVIQLAPLGLGWGDGPWTDAGIEAVGKAIQEGPAEVRSTAVLAAQSWMLEWDQVGDWWTPAQVRRAQSVFRLPAFRDAVYRSARTERRDQGNSQVLGVQVVPAYLALAISGDPRALPVIRKGMGQEPWYGVDRIKALAYVPGPATIAYLFDLIDLAVAQPSTGTQDFEADQVIGHAAHLLRTFGAKDYSRVRAHLDDRKADVAHRIGLARAFASVDSPIFFRSIERTIRDESVDEIARELATDGLARSPRPEAKAFLERWVKQAPTERLRLAAENALRDLGKR